MPYEADYRPEARAPGREELERETGLVLLEFGTAWCGICRALAPRVQELVDRRPEIKHIKVEDGPGQALGRSFGVRLWPNFVLLREGRVLEQLARPSAAELERALDAALVGGPR
jgi:thioredoxin 1